MGVCFTRPALLAVGALCLGASAGGYAADANPTGKRTTGPTQLESISVTGTRDQPVYNLPSTNTATGTSTPTLDTPFSIQAIPSTVLHDQGVTTLRDAMRDAPGVSVNHGEGNRDEFVIRGVDTKSDFFVDGLRDDSEYFRSLYNISHVDVLQGPAALLFGRGGAGGIVNLVTKKAERRDIRNLTLEGGSWNQLQATADVGGAAGEWSAFRLMGMTNHSNGFVDHDFVHMYAFNPEFSFQPDDRTKMDFSFAYSNDRRLAYRGLPSDAATGKPVDVKRSLFIGSIKDNRVEQRVTTGRFRIQHTVNDHVEVRNAFLVTRNNRRYENAYAGSSVDANGNFTMNAYNHLGTRLSYLDRLDAILKFETGLLRHQVLTGLEYSWQSDNDFEFQQSKTPGTCTPGSNTTKAIGTGNLANPLVASLDGLDCMSRLNHLTANELGLYAQDQIALGEHWLGILGVRWDLFNAKGRYNLPTLTKTNKTDAKWSPRAGIVYKPIENDSVYVSVSQTFTPQAANLALSQKTPAAANLAPQKAVNYELGNKLELVNGKLALTAAVFQLDLKNTSSIDPNNTGNLIPIGRQRNRGIQVSAEGALTTKWSVYAGYTYLDAKITQGDSKTRSGAVVGLVPNNQFNLWSTYRLTENWGFGGGLNGASGRYASVSNKVKLGSFVTGDLMAYYEAAHYRVQLNFNNIWDERYFATAGGDDQNVPGAPRNAMATLYLYF